MEISGDLNSIPISLVDNGAHSSGVKVKVLTKPDKITKMAVQRDADSKSIFVRNIHSDTTPEIIEEHFKECGSIKRITILCNKSTNKFNGYAYIEFDSREKREQALLLDNTELNGCKISVLRKRTNRPTSNIYDKGRKTSSI
ncbi:hypothetical protein KAFR_0K01170 [Kazachstania africana CBS 2517]|uniref:RRM domain-containing protein n=1 Tax=Kazachstania africana (strain ATCC 22294 / BCRC 22015 / CBS 2517 / CECT 1963 / NBRC 1671 / NRRL Y-8276) TaxID=1071382 RepID=H2B1H2_KAZAF|nr:hypothetical protein KAFR_0K01170 [Kazachstania africana CBS 2517]CCF60472.1 hypothetical protein KAFR_0K01170 [Kazachstania africana CBS 2517]